MNFRFKKYNKFNNLSYYMISSLVSTLIGLIVNPFLSLGLSHEDFAIIGYFASFSLILLPISSFSLNSYYARNYFLVNDDQRYKMLQTLLSLFLVFGLIMVLLFFLVYYFYHKSCVTSIPFSPYAILSFLPTYFAAFYNIYLLDLRMQSKSKKYAIITILNAFFGALFSLTLVNLLRYGAEGRLAAILVNAILFGVYTLRAKKCTFNIDWLITKKMFFFCFPLALSALLTFFFMGIDRVFLAKINDNYNLGLYNVGFQISGYLGIFGTVFLQTFEPNLYKYASLKDNKRLINLVILIIFVTLVPNLIFMIFSKPLISVLTYGKYINSSVYANILCVRNVTTSLSFSLSIILVGYGFSKYELYNKLIGSLISIVIYKYLIDNYGFYGAAWGQSLSWLIMGTISLIFLFIIKNKIKLEL